MTWSYSLQYHSSRVHLINADPQDRLDTSPSLHSTSYYKSWLATTPVIDVVRDTLTHNAIHMYTHAQTHTRKHSTHTNTQYTHHAIYVHTQTHTYPHTTQLTLRYILCINRHAEKIIIKGASLSSYTDK